MPAFLGERYQREHAACSACRWLHLCQSCPLCAYQSVRLLCNLLYWHVRQAAYGLVPSMYCLDAANMYSQNHLGGMQRGSDGRSFVNGTTQGARCEQHGCT